LSAGATGRTRVVYAVRTTPTLPVIGPLVLAVAKQAIRNLLGGIVKESERRAAADA
jgi:hypothetical protein